MIPLVLAVVALGQPVTVTIRPVEARRDVPIRVTVTGVDASRLLVRLRGAQTGAGKATTWLPLVRRVAVWAGSLRTPHYWGVYPLELRAGPAAAPRSSAAWLVEVLPAGFRTRPGFATPREVAAWWVRTGPPRARLVSARPWSAPAGTPHNAYNRLLEVELRLLEPWPPVWPEPGRLTMFVSVTRESLRGPWRFVDVGTGP